MFFNCSAQISTRYISVAFAVFVASLWTVYIIFVFKTLTLRGLGKKSLNELYQDVAVVHNRGLRAPGRACKVWEGGEIFNTAKYNIIVLPDKSIFRLGK